MFTKFVFKRKMDLFVSWVFVSCVYFFLVCFMGCKHVGVGHGFSRKEKFIVISRRNKGYVDEGVN